MNKAVKMIIKNSIFYKIKQLFFYKKEKEYKKILVVGGYGYNNVGDEAQLNSTIKILEKNFPQYMIKILTPNEIYTYFYHDKCLVGLAPRVSFYDQGTHWIYAKTDNPIVKLHFILRSCLIYINSFLVRADLPTFFINAKKAALLEEMKTSDMIYFEGGGYLTGKTLSRLLDGVFFIKIGKVFKVDSFLSGQTIGVWNGKINKILAKWGLKEAKIITLRDPEDSINALKEIGLSGDNIYYTHDDALFCDKLPLEKEEEKLLKIGLEKEDLNNGYITFHIHYWGLKNKEEKEELLKKMDKIVEEIRKRNKKKIVLLSMTPSDEETINDYKNRFKRYNISSLNYDYNFRTVRSVISKSDICITMKHHPIIFALGEYVPVISMALSDYYLHKNAGALKLVKLEKYNLDLSKENFLEKFISLYEDIEKNKIDFLRNLEKSFSFLKERKNKFINDILKNINNRGI